MKTVSKANTVLYLTLPAQDGLTGSFQDGLKGSLKIALTLSGRLLLPDWDIHPEMVSHTRVIDIKTGKPYPYPTPEYMENWEWSQTKSADELAVIPGLCP